MSSQKRSRQSLYTFLIAVIGIGLLLTIIFTAFSIGTAGLLLVFGISYTSWKALLLFILVFLLYGLILDLFSIAMIGFAKVYLFQTSLFFPVRMASDTCFTWLALQFAEATISGVSIEWTGALAIASVLFFGEIAYEKWEAGKKDRS